MPKTLPRVLVVDDDPDHVELVSLLLAAGGFVAVSATSAPEALEHLRDGAIDCVLSDVQMPERDGFDLLAALRASHPALPVILMTAYGDLDDAVRAVGGGACAYLPKPVAGKALREAVAAAVSRASAKAAEGSDASPQALARDAVVGHSAAIVSLYGTVARAAAAGTTPVLIRGETGVGKEWVARAVHRYGPRSRGPFVAVNCAALAEGTLESELFGHARGGFTGATAARQGLFQRAHGGVLFLDEVAELGARAQAELLRVLQEGEVRPVGDDDARAVDVRVVAATHRDLEALCRAGRFRDDLLFRLRVLEVWVPPLRERREDIALLAQHFLAHAPGASTAGRRFSPEALRALDTRDWPGNVRELQACVLRAAALSTGRVIVPGDLARPSEPPPTAPTSAAPWDALCQAALREGVLSLDALNARYARAALAHFDGNKTRAAEALGVDRKTLRRLLGPGEGA